jgi:hypothetical protein
MKHLVGYPLTALLALAVGAAPSDGATTDAAPAAIPTPAPTVTVTAPAPAPAPARTLAAPVRTVTVTVAAAGSSRSSGGASGPASGASPGGGSVYYANCSAARAAGDTPLYVGEPGYRSALDRDKDGVACE